MKKISFVVPKVFQGNKIFDAEDTRVNRDNCLASAVALKEHLKSRQIDISTSDINPVKDADLVIFENMPALDNEDFVSAKRYRKKMFLNLTEWGALHPENENLDRHQDFIRIFTYQDDLIDNVKYIKINYSFQFPEKVDIPASKKDKFCVMISGYKRFRHPYELYSKRIEAIRWFEKNHPNEFDLYGLGWNGRPRLMHYPFMVKAINRIPGFFRLIDSGFPSYRGSIASKKEVLQHYKFAICYENACDVNGWITEKIFDCFFAGCVPVYWGAPNVADHIPKDAFLDKRDFSTYESLYDFLKNMTGEKYLDYLNAISAFMASERTKLFSIDYFVETMTSQIEQEIGAGVSSVYA